MKTKVIFRKWHSSGDVIALFPEIPSDNYGHHCVSFEHVGQHSGANPETVMLLTTRATPDEYAALKRELESAPYNYVLDIRQRLSPSMGTARHQAALMV